MPRAEVPITAPPVLWSDQLDVTDLFTWTERDDGRGWNIVGPFERLTHYTVGGTVTDTGPMILTGAIDGVRIAAEARRAAVERALFDVFVPSRYVISG